MKAALVYEETEAIRNQDFINRLIGEASKHSISMSLIRDGKDEIPEDVDFVFFRMRNPKRSQELEAKGYYLVNRSQVNVLANDKWKSYQLALLQNIPVVPTLLWKENTTLSFPCVVKSRYGYGGSDVFLLQSSEDYQHLNIPFSFEEAIVQPYIETNATDIRVFMIGEEVQGAVKRQGKDSFKSNYLLGGSVETFSLASWQIDHVTTLAKAIKSDYVGFDFLLLEDGTWLFNEMEDPVGARSYYATTGIDIAVPIMEHIYTKLSK
ncbi:ATP-grasp domain-containing protein [Paenisporosarcina cavernae]|uniref:ATP-grasp domain-containing protein n=1 Tax=Paenisporosarcina cavernae TaxID=2320858 RepID=A0A385YSF2_9BACL|nr:ATP-grasp domain-containing protein [Paenisporosarcina cavernae]AYC29765.1 ATP-grasp domain-containing protein [Paenisporosarcina cavernae]